MTTKTNHTYIRRRNAGLCIRCGVVPSSKTYCDACREITRQQVMAQQQTRRDAGLCLHCDASVTAGNFCQTCRERINARGRARYGKTIASPRDRYGIKSMAIGDVRRFEDRTRRQFYSALVSLARRHKDVLAKVFKWEMVGDVLEVRRIR